MRCAERRGFTLIEIVVVLGILAISAAVVAPAFGVAVRRDTSDDVAATMVSLLALGRRTAIAKATTVGVSVDVRNGRVSLARIEDDSAIVVVDTVVSLPRGVTLSAQAPHAHWTFRLDGSATGDTLLVDGGGDARIWVDAITGMVRRHAR